MSRALVGRPPPEAAPSAPTDADVTLARRTGPLTFAVQTSLVVATGAVAVAVVTLAGNSLNAEKLIFLTTFGVGLPAACVGGAWLSVQAARRSVEHLRLLAGTAVAGVLAVVVAARVVYALGASAAPVVLAGTAALGAALAALLAVAPRRPPTGAAPVALLVAAMLVPLAVAAFLPERLLRPGPLAISILAAAAAAAALAVRRHSVRLPRWLGLLIDAAALILAVLLVVDVSSYLAHLPYNPHDVFRHPGRLTSDDETFATLVHTDFYLGPVNSVLHGRPVLVDTYSQYGVGVLYFIAAFFKLAPLGYGPMALLVGAVTALQYAAGYAILRIAGCGRVLAVLATAVAIVGSVFGTLGSIADFPSIGGLRYGPVYVLLLAAVAAARWPARARALRAAQLAILGVASLWSVETFGLAAATFAATTAASAAAEAPAWRQYARRWAADLLRGAGACVAAVILFTLLTLAFTGSRPHLRPYLTFFGIYSGDRVGIVVIPLAPAWSAGFAEGALFLASAVGLVGLVVRRAVGVPLHWLVAAAGATAFGTIAFTYWVSHTDALALPPLAFPPIIVGALWAQRAISLPRADRVLRFGGVALAAWLAALLVVFWWPQVEQKYTRSAAWQALPGGPSIIDHVRDLWRSPVIDRRALDGEHLLQRHFPGRGPAVVLIEPHLAVESLIRSRRVNRLPLGDLIEDDLIRDQLLPRVARAIDRIPFGTPMLVQLHPDPLVNPIERPLPLQVATLGLIRRRFDLQLIASGPSGLDVVRLVPHGAAGTAAR